MSKKITLIIKKLEFEAVIGILEEEREIPQKVEVNAKILVYYDKNSMVDYVTVRNTIKQTIIEGKFLTVEEALNKTVKKIGRISSNIIKINLKILKIFILKDTVVGGGIKKIFKKNKNKFKNS